MSAAKLMGPRSNMMPSTERRRAVSLDGCSWPSRSAQRRRRTVHCQPSPTAMGVDDAVVLKSALRGTPHRMPAPAFGDTLRSNRRS